MRKGFTLIEVMIVVVIIGILAAIIILAATSGKHAPKPILEPEKGAKNFMYVATPGAPPNVQVSQITVDNCEYLIFTFNTGSYRFAVVHKPNCNNHMEDGQGCYRPIVMGSKTVKQ